MKRTITARPTQPHITPITMAVTSPAGMTTETNRKAIKSEQKYRNKAIQRIKKAILQKVTAKICMEITASLTRRELLPQFYKIQNK